MNLGRVLVLLGGVFGATGLMMLFSASTPTAVPDKETIQGRIASIDRRNDWLPARPVLGWLRPVHLRLDGRGEQFLLPDGLVEPRDWIGEEVEVVATEGVNGLRPIRRLRPVSPAGGQTLTKQMVLQASERDKLNKMRIGAAGVIIAAILIVAAKLVGVYARVRAEGLE